MVSNMSDPCGVMAIRPGIDMPWKLLTYFRNRFLPESEISEAVAGGNMPPPTVATTLPPSTFTDTVYVPGPICDVTAAVHSPRYGAACAGVTVEAVICARTAGVRPGDTAAITTTVSESRPVSARRNGNMGISFSVMLVGASATVPGMRLPEFRKLTYSRSESP